MRSLIGMLVLMAVVITPVRSHAAGDANQGAQVFRQCQACHSLEPDRHLTGPSLAHIWGRKAGTARGFHRYSKALKNANVTWNAESLDAWLKNPREFIPRNYMGFAGIENPQARQDLIAYLKVASNEQPSKGDTAQGGGMMGQTGSRPALNLKELTPKQQVEAMRYCGDAYFVTLGSGETFAFWEFNLRFKTDSSQDGPHKGKPAIVRAGMRGDRGFVVFAGPEEISAFIKKQC